MHIIDGSHALDTLSGEGLYSFGGVGRGGGHLALLNPAEGEVADVNRVMKCYTDALLFSRRAGLARRVGPGGCGGEYEKLYFAHIAETMSNFFRNDAK